MQIILINPRGVYMCILYVVKTTVLPVEYSLPLKQGITCLLFVVNKGCVDVCLLHCLCNCMQIKLTDVYKENV